MEECLDCQNGKIAAMPRAGRVIVEDMPTLKPAGEEPRCKQALLRSPSDRRGRWVHVM